METEVGLRERAGRRGRMRVWSALVATVISAGLAGVGAHPAAAAVPVGLGQVYNSVQSMRILDTRGAVGGHHAKLGAGATLTLRMPQTVLAANAAAVTFNLTVANATKTTFLTAWPTGLTRPSASNINVKSGVTVANFVTVQLGGGADPGMVSIFNAAGSVDVIVDLTGYFSPTPATFDQGSSYNPALPFRLLDTRTTIGGHHAKLKAGQTLELAVPLDRATGVKPVAVTVNVTVTDATANSFLTVWDSDFSRPTASTINFRAGDTRANLATVPVSSDTQTISIANAAGSVNVIVDITGFYVPLRPNGFQFTFFPMAPTRVLDTRTSIGAHHVKLKAGETMVLQLPDSGLDSNLNPAPVSVNVTVANATAKSFLTVWGNGDPKPSTSNISFEPGSTVANFAVVNVDGNENTGKINIFNAAGTVDVIIDLAGVYFEVDTQPTI